MFGDIIDLHFQMIGLKHRFRPLHLIDIGHHGENVAGAGGLDGLGECGERANVNHGIPSGFTDYMMYSQGGQRRLSRRARHRFRSKIYAVSALKRARNRFSALAAVQGVR